MYYLLKDRIPVLAPDVVEWARWFEPTTVSKTTLPSGTVINTVFLGLDTSFVAGLPILFETMVFGGPLAEAQARYATWDQAEAGHLEMVSRCEQAENPPIVEGTT